MRLLRRAYFDAVNDVITRSATSILVDKMPFNLLHVGLLLRVFPRARIIRALRHPANVALSNFKQNYEEPHSALLFSKLPQIIDLSDKFDQLWVAQINGNASRTMTVKFEDLVTETARTTAGVFKFLGESDALLDDNARREHAREKLNRVTPNYSSITAPLDNRNSSQWRNYSAQFAPYLDRLFKLAAAQGYSDDST